MTLPDERSDVSRLERLTSRPGPEEMLRDHPEEATRSAFLAWGAELERHARNLDISALLSGVQDRLRKVPATRTEHLATLPFPECRVRLGRPGWSALLASVAGIALVLLAAFTLWEKVPVPSGFFLTLVPFGGNPLSQAAPTSSREASPAGGMDRVAVASESPRGEPMLDDAPFLSWEDAMDRDLERTAWEMWQMLHPTAQVDGRLARMSGRLAELQEELHYDSL